MPAVPRFNPELIDTAWRLAMNRVAKNPELRKIANLFTEELPEGLIPARTIASGNVTPEQAKALLRVRTELREDFPDFAKDIRNMELSKKKTGAGSIRTRVIPGLYDARTEAGIASIGPDDIRPFSKMIQEMSQGSLIARDATEPFTAYRSYTPFFPGIVPNKSGVLSFTETPQQMVSRWTGGNRLTWQPTTIDPADVTFDYGIGTKLRPEETEIQALASMVKQAGGELSLEDLIRLGTR